MEVYYKVAKCDNIYFLVREINGKVKEYTMTKDYIKENNIKIKEVPKDNKVLVDFLESIRIKK